MEYHNFYIVLAGLVVYGVYRWRKNPATPEQIRLERWQDLSRLISYKYRLNRKEFLPKGFNLMEISLARRKIIHELVKTGHAKAASGVLAEVDDILATIEANLVALDEYGIGRWVPTSRSNLHVFYAFQPSEEERPAALWSDTVAMCDKLNEIIAYIRSIAKEGVTASTESIKVHLQVHLQDFQAEAKASAETAKELEARPL